MKTLLSKFKDGKSIYIIKNTLNGKYYVGESLNVGRRLREHRTHKTQYIDKVIRKYGPENFAVFVEYFSDADKELLVDIEGQIIQELDSLIPKGYNVLPRGQNRAGYKHTEETRKKMSEAQLNRPPIMGRPCSEETRAKIAKSNTGKKMSDEQKDKISKSKMGIKTGPLSAEVKAKMSRSKMGKKRGPVSQETRIKLSISGRAYNQKLREGKI